MKTFLVLLKKDFSLELKRPENLSLLIVLAILLSIMSVFGVNTLVLTKDTEQSLFPVLLWLIFIFSSTISLGRSLEQEFEERSLDNLILFKISMTKIYLAKMLVNFCLILLSHILTALLLIILLDIGLLPMPFLIISFLAALAYSSLSTLLAGISATSKLKGLLLPIILLPLLFPVFFAAIELTTELVLNQSFNISDSLVSLLIALNVIYIALGINLYEHTISE